MFVKVYFHQTETRFVLLMFPLARCVIPNQPFVYDALPCKVDLPMELMVTNSSSTLA